MAAAKQAAQTFKKYTVQPQGIWAKVSDWLQIDSKRSTGVPLNPLFRNPPPAGNNPADYDDPVTAPAGDIAENPYWKRDVRRSYPRLSVVNQGDVVGLLSVGSQAAPREDVLQIGDAGQKQLVAVQEEGQKTGLPTFFKKDKANMAAVLGPDGLPPMPSNLGQNMVGKQYSLDAEQSYEGDPISEIYKDAVSDKGVPIHPSGQIPEAPCPLCSAEKGDSSSKKLFGVRGCDKDQYDAQIPDSYFDTPPIKLDSSGKGMDALRFQYLALARFAANVFAKLQEAHSTHTKLMEKANARRRDVESQLQTQSTRIKSLEQSEKAYQHWKQREPKVMYYLGIFRQTMEDNENLRAQLASYGADVPPKRFTKSFEDSNDPQQAAADTETAARGHVVPYHLRTQQSDHNPRQNGQDTASSRTLSGRGPQSASNAHNAALTHDAGLDNGATNVAVSGHQTLRTGSRARMPPPPLPSKRPRQDLSFKLDEQERDHRHHPASMSVYANESPSKLLQPRGQILLRDDGTWERLQHNQSQPRRLSPIPTQELGKRHEYAAPYVEEDASATAHHQYETVPQFDDYTPWQPQYPTKGNADNRGYTCGYRGLTQQQSPTGQTAVDPLDPLDESSLNQNIYHQQSRRHRLPLQQLSPSRINITSPLRQTPHSLRERGPVPLENYRFTDVEDLHSTHQSPSKTMYEGYHSRSGFAPQYEPRQLQQPLTPSPTKQPFQNLAESVASPFFKNNTARNHTGRLTLRDRRQGFGAPNAVTTPALSRHHRSYGNRTAQNSLDLPSTPRNLVSVPFLGSERNAAVVPASPYFSQQRSGPIVPRSNLFADSRRPDDGGHLAQIPSGVHSNKIGNSGVTRMSIEGQRRGGSLGDYLAANMAENSYGSHQHYGKPRTARRLARR
ncbi:MAG: hypothetical protein Q9162_001687 [Coniocarpon cinnabarinum]